MRFESPVHLGHRWVAEDIEIDGRRFAAGTKVMVVWASANLDPDAVDDPLTVDLERTRGSPRQLRQRLPPLPRLAPRPARAAHRPRGAAPPHPRLPDHAGGEPVYINYGVRAAIQLPLSFTPTV